MRLLLDTHAPLWHATADPKLSAPALAAISDPGNEVFVSVASLWEMAVKVAKGSLNLHRPFPDFIHTAVVVPCFPLLGVSYAHLFDLLALPFRHKDPFDRMRVAQARTEGLTLVTCDDKIALYSVPQLW